MPAPDLWDITRPLAPVRYAFRVHDWKGPPWHVRRFKLHEALNAPYRLTVELVTSAPSVDIDALLGDSCELRLDRHAADRTLHGIVLAAEELGRSGGFLQLRLEVGPALALLAQRVDSRAWQDKTVPEILRDVLAPLSELGRGVRLDALRQDSYPRREYCVQYGESDLVFAARLMEEEGISYFFDHDGAAETLVLVDDNADFRACADGPLLLQDNQADTASHESILSFVAGRRLVSTAVAQRNFDWTQPQAPLAAAHAGADRRGRTREVYEHDDLVYPGDGERHARLKHERLSLRARLSSGRSNVTGLSAGGAFALHGHAHPELDGQYIVVSADHEGDAPEESMFAAAATAPRYINTFEAAPLSAPVRPPRLHAKPRVSGLLTATVTGPPGEEVHCDEYGRIKILPHWDRLSPADDTSSWWVRVAQPVAGGGWGFFWLPRVGMEVIVDFLGGDPDRPLVLGCVYNGANAPPYSLPADKTKITLKSNSSPGGGGSNELRFEDQAGAEEVYIHAQRDFNTVVDANRTLSVGANDTSTIGANRTATIGANDSTTVGANKSVTVAAGYSESCGASHSVSVGAAESISVGTSQCVTVGADQSITVGASQTVAIVADQSTIVGGNQSATVTGNQTNTVTGNQVDIITGDQTHKVTGDQKNTITGDQINIVTGSQTHEITADHSLTVTGTHKVDATGAVEHTFSAGAKVDVTGAYKLTLSGELTLDAGGKALLKASRVEIEAGDSKVTVEPGRVTVEGGCVVDITSTGDVNINGDGQVNVKGGTIKLNC